MSKLFGALTMAATLATSVVPMAANAAVTTVFSPGDLIKGSGQTVYYFGWDGRRYVFPNEKTYFTWYKDFSTVKQIPDTMLQTVPLGRRNVTYRPGVKMVKVTTDPRTYVIDQGGILRHVPSQQMAETLYGIAWKNQIDDLPDAFYADYKVGTALVLSSDFTPADVMTLTTNIAIDKQMDQTAVTVSIGSKENGFVPPSLTVKKGTLVTWTNTDSSLHRIVGNGWQSQDLKYQESYQRVFSTVGSFDYGCGIYPVMNGTINVIE
ncbi:MAG: cupredoxin domain-containing protein [Patescibacteria group bacterium]|nr:cupredoxin domain-containing protein [Patescibacteria group bacterium]